MHPSTHPTSNITHPAPAGGYASVTYPLPLIPKVLFTCLSQAHLNLTQHNYHISSVQNSTPVIVRYRETAIDVPHPLWFSPSGGGAVGLYRYTVGVGTYQDREPLRMCLPAQSSNPEFLPFSSFSPRRQFRIPPQLLRA